VHLVQVGKIRLEPTQTGFNVIEGMPPGNALIVRRCTQGRDAIGRQDGFVPSSGMRLEPVANDCFCSARCL